MNSSETYRKEIKKLAGESRYVSNEERRAIKKRKKKALRDLIIKAVLPLGILAGLILFSLIKIGFINTIFVALILFFILGIEIKSQNGEIDIFTDPLCSKVPGNIFYRDNHRHDD